MAEMQDQLERLTNQRKDKLWEILFAISCVTIFTLPIILNVSLYKDDFNRAYGGTLQWDTDGRIIGYLLYRIAHLGSTRAVFDHPLGALVCIPIMLLGGIFAYLLFQRKSLIWIGILSILLFGQPYFLENLSFSFDSPLMVLSTSICIAAAWICVSGEKPYLQAVSGGLVTIALLIYQPANNAFWIPVCVIAINSWGQTIKTGENNNPLVFSTRKLLFRCGLIQASSLAIYKIILTPFFKLNEYSNSVLSTLEIKNLPSTVVRNINEFCDTLLRNGFDSNLGRFLAFYILISIILITSRHTIWRGCIKFIMLLSILALSQGLMLVLNYQGLPVRTYIGVGAFLVSIAPIAWSTFEEKWHNPFIKRWIRRIYLIIVSAIVWGLINCSFAYGSAYRAQTDLNNYYRQTIANNILRDNSVLEGKINKMVIIGKSPDSPIAKNTFKIYPFMSKIIDRVDGAASGIRLFRQYGLVLKHAPESDLKSTNLQNNSRKQLIDRPDYAITQQKEIIVVRFK